MLLVCPSPHCRPRSCGSDAKRIAPLPCSFTQRRSYTCMRLRLSVACCSRCSSDKVVSEFACREHVTTKQVALLQAAHLLMRTRECEARVPCSTLCFESENNSMVGVDGNLSLCCDAVTREHSTARVPLPGNTANSLLRTHTSTMLAGHCVCHVESTMLTQNTLASATPTLCAATQRERMHCLSKHYRLGACKILQKSHACSKEASNLQYHGRSWQHQPQPP